MRFCVQIGLKANSMNYNLFGFFFLQAGLHMRICLGVFCACSKHIRILQKKQTICLKMCPICFHLDKKKHHSQAFSSIFYQRISHFSTSGVKTGSLGHLSTHIRRQLTRERTVSVRCMKGNLNRATESPQGSTVSPQTCPWWPNCPFHHSACL